MGITAKRLKELGLVDEVLPEPLGGAHRNPQQMFSDVKGKIVAQIDRLQQLDTDSLLDQRYHRLMSYGAIG